MAEIADEYSHYLTVPFTVNIASTSPRGRIEGIGNGLTVDLDCEIALSFPYTDVDGSRRHTHPISLFCGILPDTSTPADLILGRSIHTKSGIILRDVYCVELTRPSSLTTKCSIMLSPIRKLAATIHVHNYRVMSIALALSETATNSTLDTDTAAAIRKTGPAELAKFMKQLLRRCPTLSGVE